jgi:hypothetical protein
MPDAKETLQVFDIANAEVKIWTFKKSAHTGVTAPTYTGHWVDISAALQTALRNAVIAQRARITEVHDYGLLAQINEASALSIKLDETHAPLILEKIGDEIVTRKANDLKKINNSDFYVIKLVGADGNTIYAASRTDNSWRAKKLEGLITAIFSDQALDLNTDRAFNLSNRVDFFIVGDDILILNKPNFESILSHKQAHVADFNELKVEPEFVEIFSEMVAITEYVGENKIRLRRALAIRQKGHYKDPVFMRNLRANFATYGLTLTFDQQGKLVVTDETCADAFTALLDHRLKSPFSSKVYDVQDTASVNI